MDTLSLTKKAKIYNGEKTVSLTSGAGEKWLATGKSERKVAQLCLTLSDPMTC